MAAKSAATAVNLQGRYIGKRVLLADDNQINQLFCKEIFEKIGLIVELANNGKEAVHMVSAAQVPYDLVILDIQMPEMDGWEAARAIRATRAEETLPIVALSANAYDEDRQKSMEAGMNDHLAKPLDMREVNLMLETFLG
jgi:two-component system, sensor histidine kinase and response regulator